jgi:hypothetical protein
VDVWEEKELVSEIRKYRREIMEKMQS